MSTATNKTTRLFVSDVKRELGDCCSATARTHMHRSGHAFSIGKKLAIKRDDWERYIESLYAQARPKRQPKVLKDRRGREIVK